MRSTNRRRLIMIASLVLAPTAVLFAACGFPDVSFTPDQEGGTLESSASEAIAQPDAAGLDGNISKGDAARDDAQQVVAADACDARPKCDCDNDHYLATGCDDLDAASKAQDGALKGLGDCDDLNPNKYPDAGYTALVPRPELNENGDWNCDGIIETFTKKAACGTLCGANPEGYVADPGCGGSGDIYGCKLGALACEFTSTGKNVTQLCR